LAGIAAAEQAGLPGKLNMVVMRGVNDDELSDFAALTLHQDVTVRFIEHMPAAQAVDSHTLLLPGSTILNRLAESFSLEPLARGELSGPAQEFKISGAVGTIGLITPLSGHFCGECNRIRVDSSGFARSCLFGSPGANLKPLLTAGGTPLEAALRLLVAKKPARHLLNEPATPPAPFTMATIGG
jgi:cyclic pyranopterin phosphate synthase